MDQVITSSVANDLSLLKNGSYSSVSGDVLDHTVYDSQLFQATTARATTTFFTTPIGGAYGSGVKTKVETNLQDPGKFPAGQGFLIKEVGFAGIFADIGTTTVANTNAQAMVNILQFSTFEIRIAGREFDLQLPGSMFTPSMMTLSLASAANGIRLGDYLSSGWFKLSAPITIGELVSFNMTQITQSAVTALQTIVNNASNTLNGQNAALQMKFRGTLVRSK